MKLTVLGSLSPCAYKDKNGVGFLLQNKGKNIIVDAGSGICRNLDLENILGDLTIIISHLHRDHFCELLPLSYLALIYSRRDIIVNKIKVYIPLEENNLVSSYVKSLVDDSYFEFIEYDENTKLNIGNIDISFKESRHTDSCRCFHMKFISNGKSICYSADTGYENNNLASFCENVDLLISEASILKDDTKYKDNHLTTLEAGSIAKNGGVKKLMLCHFWPTIDKEVYLNETKEIFENTICAIENQEYYF